MKPYRAGGRREDEKYMLGRKCLWDSHPESDIAGTWKHRPDMRQAGGNYEPREEELSRGGKL